VFTAADDNRDLLRIVFLNPDPRTEVARRMKHSDQARTAALIDIIQGGMQAGTVREGDAAMLARLINSVVIIALYQCFIEQNGGSVHAFEETVTEMIVGALTPALG